MRLSKIFRKKEFWTKNCACRDEFGYSVNINETPIDSERSSEFVKKIKSWSLYGAVAFHYSYPSNKRYHIMDKLKHAIQRVTGKQMTVPEFNDSPTTTFEQIQKVIKIAEKQ